MVDTIPVITVVEGDVFQRWLGRLRDYHAVARINARLRQITAFGQLGDTRAVGDGIYELRVHHGPGYRIYFVHTARVPSGSRRSLQAHSSGGRNSLPSRTGQLWLCCSAAAIREASNETSDAPSDW